ncbi:MAG TPA: 3-deoxy-manno-octulosonate cytidylyltransferase, partial [Gammaproteobacteria bacterium]|nr:3-deoxy-manno-octulosonate cytidylyltransferase [Gammaproteobacteria bacterium]
MRFRVIIPARYASVRLPGKPLAALNGRPLVLHVCDRARESGAQQIIVATDDARVQAACAGAGVEVQMTRSQHASGTDRIAEVVRRLELPDDDVIVNLQGDEPMMPAADIEQVAALLNSHQNAQIATLCTAINDIDEFLNPNVVKVT